MLCACHGEPSYWHRDRRHSANGYWRCPVAKHDHWQRHRERKVAQQRERYDLDPIFRIEKRLRDDRRDRANTLKRRRETHGSLPLEGRHRPSVEPDP